MSASRPSRSSASSVKRTTSSDSANGTELGPCRAQRRQQTDNSIVAPELTLRGISHARRRKAKNMSSNGVLTATKDAARLVLTISRYLNTDARNRSPSTTRSPLTAATCHSDTIGAWLRILTIGVTAGCEIPGQAGPLTKRPGFGRAKLELHHHDRRPCPNDPSW
jgi:hypothetical protein